MYLYCNKISRNSVFKITLTEKQKKYEDIRWNKFKDQCKKSRAKWVEEGEKPLKYFIHPLNILYI